MELYKDYTKKQLLTKCNRLKEALEEETKWYEKRNKEVKELRIENTRLQEEVAKHNRRLFGIPEPLLPDTPIGWK
tara:strand:- start:3252 stop:3476 length:225 start_codon:yes stop_codon:yes gene_type:complete